MNEDGGEVIAAWARVPADEAESWVLGTGAVGWVRAEHLAAAARATERVRKLEERHRQLESECDDARAAARSAGFAEGRAALRDAVDELAGARDALSSRAWELALNVAAVVIEGELRADPSRAKPLIDRALSGRVGRSPTGIRLAPGIGEALAAEIPDLPPVVADTQLGPGDVVLEYSDGKVDAPLSRVLEMFARSTRDGEE